MSNDDVFLLHSGCSWFMESVRISLVVEDDSGCFRFSEDVLCFMFYVAPTCLEVHEKTGLYILSLMV